MRCVWHGGRRVSVCERIQERVRQVEEITVNVGELVTSNSGITNDTRQAVQFTGEDLGTYREYGIDRHGKITDTRGTAQTLYRVADGGLVVHVHEWSRWMGEPDTESLHAVTEKSLQPTGTYARLGAACGFGRPLTLEEAIGPIAGTEPPAVRLTSAGGFVDTDEEPVDRSGFLFKVQGDNNKDWDMIAAFGDWLNEVVRDSHPMGQFLAYVDAVLEMSPIQTQDPDTDED